MTRQRPEDERRLETKILWKINNTNDDDDDDNNNNNNNKKNNKNNINITLQPSPPL